MIRRTIGRFGVLLPRDHRAHRMFYINKSKQEPGHRGSQHKRHVTTTASCRSRNWQAVRASVGVSEVVRSTAVDHRKTTWHFVLVADSPEDP